MVEENGKKKGVRKRVKETFGILYKAGFGWGFFFLLKDADKLYPFSR